MRSERHSKSEQQLLKKREIQFAEWDVMRAKVGQNAEKEKK
jgi:hypothetical protein